MRLKILAVGTRMPGWVNEAYTEYANRLPHEIRLEVIELPLGQRGKNSDIRRAIAKEGEAMLKAIDDRDRVVALDVKGKP